MTTKEAVALLERYSNYDGMGIPNLAGCKEAMRVAVDALKEACPELAESEDERIRTRLIEYFQGFLEGNEDCYKDGGYVRWEGLDVKSLLAWLEKQKEQKQSLSEKFRPDFPAVADFIESVDDMEKNQAIGILEDYLKWAVSSEEECRYTWKELADAIQLGIDAMKEQKPAEWSGDIIRKAVKEVGLTQHQIDWFKTNVFPPKQEWSEEDENVIETLIRELRLNAQFEFAVRNLGLDYVQTLTVLDKCRRLCPRPSWKPSEEQMKALQNAVALTACDKELARLYNQLKKL